MLIDTLAVHFSSALTAAFETVAEDSTTLCQSVSTVSTFSVTRVTVGEGSATFWQPEHLQLLEHVFPAATQSQYFFRQLEVKEAPVS